MMSFDTVLRALADPTRRRALALLAGGGEFCVCELMSALRVTQSRMSRHMSTLKAAGLVRDRREAQWVRYRANANLPSAVAGAIAAILAVERGETVPAADTGAIAARAGIDGGMR